MEVRGDVTDMLIDAYANALPEVRLNKIFIANKAMSVKAYLIGKDDCHEEIRRFVLTNQLCTSFKCLKKKVFDVFPCIGTAPFQMYYKESNGDMIAFSSDEELRMGYALVEDSTFMIFIERATHGREWNPALEDY